MVVAAIDRRLAADLMHFDLPIIDSAVGGR